MFHFSEKLNPALPFSYFQITSMNSTTSKHRFKKEPAVVLSVLSYNIYITILLWCLFGNRTATILNLGNSRNWLTGKVTGIKWNKIPVMSLNTELVDHPESPDTVIWNLHWKGRGTKSTPLFSPTLISSSQDFKDFHPSQEGAMGSSHRERGNK